MPVVADWRKLLTADDTLPDESPLILPYPSVLFPEIQWELHDVYADGHGRAYLVTIPRLSPEDFVLVLFTYPDISITRVSVTLQSDADSDAEIWSATPIWGSE